MGYASKVFRDRRDKLYKVLNTSKPSLLSLAQKAYTKKIIERDHRISIEENLSASMLLDHIELKVDLCPDLQSTVFEIMGESEYLKDIVDEMRTEIQRNEKQERQHEGETLIDRRNQDHTYLQRLLKLLQEYLLKNLGKNSLTRQLENMLTGRSTAWYIILCFVLITVPVLLLAHFKMFKVLQEAEFNTTVKVLQEAEINTTVTCLWGLLGISFVYHTFFYCDIFYNNYRTLYFVWRSKVHGFIRKPRITPVICMLYGIISVYELQCFMTEWYSKLLNMELPLICLYILWGVKIIHQVAAIPACIFFLVVHPVCFSRITIISVDILLFIFFNYLHGYITYFPIQSLWILLLYLRFAVLVYDLKQDIVCDNVTVKLTQLKKEAKNLKQQFCEVLEKICLSLDEVDIKILKLRINVFLQTKEESVRNHLDELKIITTQNDILNFLIDRRFLGYLNYELIKVFQINNEVISAIEEYELKHKALFSAITFSTLVELFRQNSKLAPVSPTGLPEFKIYLEDPWETKSVYDLKEVFEKNMISRWPSYLIVKSISCECVILTYTVLPILVPAILKDLKSSRLVKALEIKGIKMEFSPLQDNIDLPPVSDYQGENLFKKCLAVIWKMLADYTIILSIILIVGLVLPLITCFVSSQTLQVAKLFSFFAWLIVVLVIMNYDANKTAPDNIYQQHITLSSCSDFFKRAFPIPVKRELGDYPLQRGLALLMKMLTYPLQQGLIVLIFFVLITGLVSFLIHYRRIEILKVVVLYSSVNCIYLYCNIFLSNYKTLRYIWQSQIGFLPRYLPVIYGIIDIITVYQLGLDMWKWHSKVHIGFPTIYFYHMLWISRVIQQVLACTFFVIVYPVTYSWTMYTYLETKTHVIQLLPWQIFHYVLILIWTNQGGAASEEKAFFLFVQFFMLIRVLWLGLLSFQIMNISIYPLLHHPEEDQKLSKDFMGGVEYCPLEKVVVVTNRIVTYYPENSAIVIGTDEKIAGKYFKKQPSAQPITPSEEHQDTEYLTEATQEQSYEKHTELFLSQVYMYKIMYIYSMQSYYDVNITDISLY